MANSTPGRLSGRPVSENIDEVTAEAQFAWAEIATEATLALLERWTGVTIAEGWFGARKPTFVVETTNT